MNNNELELTKVIYDENFFALLNKTINKNIERLSKKTTRIQEKLEAMENLIILTHSYKVGSTLTMEINVTHNDSLEYMTFAVSVEDIFKIGSAMKVELVEFDLYPNRISQKVDDALEVAKEIPYEYKTTEKFLIECALAVSEGNTDEIAEKIIKKIFPYQTF